MDSRIKKIIKKIIKIDISNPVDMFGDVIADILFKKGEFALFVNYDNLKVLLLLPPNTKSNIKKEKLLLLIELLAVLKELEEKKLIYVEEGYSLSSNFFYQGKVTFEKDQRPGLFKISDQTFLKCNDDNQVSLIVNGKDILNTTAALDKVALSLTRYLCGVILPTRSLKNFVSRGFKTKEERNTQLGLRYSIVSMIIAVGIASISPIISVLTANKFGFATIRNDQMDSILKVSKPVYIVEPIDSFQKKRNANKILKSQIEKKHGK